MRQFETKQDRSPFQTHKQNETNVSILLSLNLTILGDLKFLLGDNQNEIKSL